MSLLDTPDNYRHYVEDSYARVVVCDSERVPLLQEALTGFDIRFVARGANDDHGVLLLHHHFEREGKPRSYRTAHIVQLVNGKIASWVEHPGSMEEFEDAWGAR